MRHLLAATLLPPAMLLALWLAIPGYALFWDDNAIQNYPLIRAAQERVWRGDIPFWKHTTLLGAPFFAEGQPGALYPLYSLAWLAARPPLTQPERILEIIALLHAALGGLGMFLLARALVRHPEAALLGALAYSINGFWQACARGWIVMPVVQSWLPLLCWATLRAMEGDRAQGKRVALASGLWAIQAYSGYPHYALLNAAMMGLTGFVVAASERNWRKLGRVFAILFPAGMLAAPLWLPMRDLAEESIRAGGLLSAEEAVRLSLPPSRLLGALFPHWPAETHVVYAYAFFGAPAVLLALMGWIAGARRWPLWWKLSLAFLVVGLPLTLGKNLPGAIWLFRLPILDLFRWPFKNLYLLHFAGSLAAAGGMAWALTRPNRRVVWGGLALASAALAVDGLARTAVAESGVYLRGVWPVAAVGFGLAWAMRGKRSFRQGAGWALALATLATLGLTGASLRNYAVYWQRNDPPGAYVANLKGPDRTFIAASFFDDARHARALGLPPEINARFIPPAAWRAFCLPDLGGAPAASGYSPIISRRYAALLGVDMFSFLRPSVRGKMIELLREGSLFDMLSVGVVFAQPRDFEINRALQAGGYRPRQDADSPWVIAWENPDPMPRAFCAEEVEIVSDERAALEAVHSAGPRLRKVAFVLADPGLTLRGGPGNVSDYQELPDAIRVQCETPGPAFLVINSSWFPGWSASVDGQPAYIEETNFALMGVEIPGAGSHVIELTYEPPSFLLGCGLAGIAALLLIFGVLRERRPKTSMSEDA